MRMTYIKNGETLALDPALCTGCGECIEVCPHAVFAMKERKSAIVDREACMECGACARNCAFGAITVKAGVGCAAAVIGGILRGRDPTCGPECGCGDTGARTRKRAVTPIPLAGGVPRKDGGDAGGCCS